MTSREERQVENYRKLLLSVAKDARVILIKLADRLHNMRTLDWLPGEARASRRRRATCTRRWRTASAWPRCAGSSRTWRSSLEPEEYDARQAGGAEAREREALIAQMASRWSALARPAFPCTKWRAPEASVVDLQEDGEARSSRTRRSTTCSRFACSCENVIECYHALGVIHDGWTPLQERIKDYIAQPKSNGYQSLHTTVFGPARQLFEIQIRTRDMHRTAEFGIAAHWLYKENKGGNELDRHLAWFRQVLELQLDAETPGEFLEFLKLDLYQDEIFVFTPTGDVIQLPKGATPLDFAFAVHTQVGCTAQGAKVNGRIAPLSRELKNSETVEISPIAERAAEPRLAGARAHRTRAPQDPQWLRHEEQTSAGAAGAGDPRSRAARRGCPRPTMRSCCPRREALKLKDATHVSRRSGRATCT
jgi:GTP diphosphokinase / guanosine-3',5'-bis(diphosphate) 3'-diphosphatase